MVQRLPQVNGDDGQWGTILNTFLGKEHYDDTTDNIVNGGHKNITVRAGVASVGGAPLKFASGVLLGTPEAGALEFNTDKLYLTQTTATTRKVVATYDDSSGATGDTYYRDANGNFIRLPIGTPAQVLTVSMSTGVPQWVTGGAGSGLTQQQVMAISSMRM